MNNYWVSVMSNWGNGGHLGILVEKWIQVRDMRSHWKSLHQGMQADG